MLLGCMQELCLFILDLISAPVCLCTPFTVHTVSVSGLLENFCSYVLSQKSNLYMVKTCPAQSLVLLLLYYTNTLKISCFTLVLITAMGIFVPSFIPLFVVSFCFLDYRENGKIVNCDIIYTVHGCFLKYLLHIKRYFT